MHLATSALIKQEVSRLSSKLPEGYQIVYPRDNTPFVQESIKEVVKTLFEAVLLVIVVMFVFLQNWRATLIPTITVPVVILGTLAILYVLGMSINTLTLFALVLAIGLLVDDAIVVVENVERLMHEQQMSAQQASIASMQEISGGIDWDYFGVNRSVYSHGLFRWLDRSDLPSVFNDLSCCHGAIAAGRIDSDACAVCLNFKTQ